MSNQAWVTLATNDSYSLGALVLAHSLRGVGSAYPAVVLITPSVTESMRERLRAVFAEVVVVDVLDSRDAAHLALLQRPELGITFTKIHCWNLTQYEKGVFLDADTLVVQNCDELFDREELSAAPDVGWPDCFNSGVFVFKPSAETFSNLITFASERGSFDGGDQGLLNSYFSDWAHGDINKHLPFLYNVTSAAFYSYLPALKHFGQNLKIIHFIGAAKPWLQQFNWESRSVQAPEHLSNFLQLWWDIFVAQVHAQLDVNMDNIEDDSSVVHQQEIAKFREPVFHNIYYEPILDPDSEFPWHHPDNQNLDSEINIPEIDMSQFHDPWNIYRGHIPPSTEQSTPTEQTIDDYQDMRKYAWDYMPPQQEYRKSDSSYSCEQKSPDHYHLHEHNEISSTYSNSHHSEHKHQSHFSPFHSESHNFQQHSEHYYNNNLSDSAQLHLQDTQMTLHNSVEQQQTNHQEPHHFHEHHYTYIDRAENNESNLNVQNNESQNNNHVSNIPNSVHDNEGSIKHKKWNRTFPSQYEQQNKTEQVYTVMMDHVRMRCQHSSEIKDNGYDSDSDSDVYEEPIPRHPYDGFYLRHRMTIDSRGRKVCIHEIPFIPRSPTPESSEEFEDALETISEGSNDKSINYEEIQTGVAANLARVVPGAPLQQEAVDELARRQGWEAGNIDYMGADSFDNIWAKISQTLSLNQPASQSEQAAESQSEPAAQQVGETVAGSAVEAVSEKQTVLSALEKEVTTSTAKIEAEVPKSTESEIMDSVPAEVSTLSKEPEPAEIPVPPSEAKPSAEERRKPVGKLQLRPPVATDPLSTPDSELEDAATLAHAIIAGELRTPTVTAPSPPAHSPATPAVPAEQLSRLSIQEPEVPTPPVGSVALSQIGVKPKPSTAAQIESSVSAKTEVAPKPAEASDAPKKKIVKKVLKKDKEGVTNAEAPVPPPRKKEKKPKEK
ncbi:uncharacterized protein LOC126768650 isoform X2 [Nymphalis io]|uniref:uncharacterized protein LOC126768650 isoform X2 n=1 Tax=Inachis io TaxID=171585 RepID=UPI002168C61D|nr:uncharacterized protein LOC126768650 isoform X2 [Nymphalis io]